MLEKQQLETKELIEKLEKTCIDNPEDAKSWKDCALAWIRLSQMAPMDRNGIGLTELIEAKSKLKQVVKIEPDDHNAKWLLGEVYMYMTLADFGDSDSIYKKRCTKALECFNQVRALKPDFRKDSSQFKSAEEGLEDLKNKPARLAKLSAMQVDLRSKLFVALEACKDNPKDVKNWISWCKVLVESKGILDDNELDKDKLCEAKKRLKAALKIKPGDREARWSLGEVYMLIISADSSIILSNALYKKFCTKAIECFDDVRSVEPEFHRGSTGPLEAQQGLNYVRNCF